MIRIGLTGGIGSGKSLISNVFKLLGAYVYNTDIAAKNIYHTNADLKQKLINYFGQDVYLETGKINRQFLSKQIFNDKKKLELLNNWVHPLVQQDFENQQELHKNSPYIVKESAILIESGAYRNVDKIIVVTAPKPVRIERVCRRDNTSQQEVERRIKNQLDDNERLKYAHFVVENDDKKLVIPQVLNIHNKLING